MANILYFMRGMPTEAQRAECGAANAKMRDASSWVDGDFVEKCDAVMGAEEDIPAPYKALPRHSLGVAVGAKAADAADGVPSATPETKADKPDKGDKSKGKTKAADAADGDTPTP